MKTLESTLFNIPYAKDTACTAAGWQQRYQRYQRQQRQQQRRKQEFREATAGQPPNGPMQVHRGYACPMHRQGVQLLQDTRGGIPPGEAA